MEGLDYMNLEVKILDGCLDVVCSFRITTDEVFFSLAHSFSVISVTDGGEPVFLNLFLAIRSHSDRKRTVTRYET